MNKQSSPKLKKYLTTSKITEIIMSIIDNFFSLFIKNRKQKKIAQNPKSILISNMGGIGDVVVATSVLPVLISAFPKAKIDFLVETSRESILENHNAINKIHHYTHILGRSRKKLNIKKVIKFLIEYIKMIFEIKKENYDIGIELFPVIQNNILLMYLAKIQVRIGFSSGGMGFLLTHQLSWIAKNQHISKYHLELLEILPITNEDIMRMKISLPHNKYSSVLTDNNLQKQQYIVFHIGASQSFRQWQFSKWQKLAQMLIKDKYKIVFTGYGDKDLKEINRIIRGLNSFVNLCNQLDLNDLSYLIKNARLLVSVDTATIHLSSAFEIPCFVICTGIHPNIWYPMHSNHVMYFNKVSCIPCYRPFGCSEMKCIRDINVRDVYTKCKIFLNE